MESAHAAVSAGMNKKNTKCCDLCTHRGIRKHRAVK